MKRDIIDKLTARLLDMINSDGLVWNKSWKSNGLVPVNYSSGRPYSGFNRLILSLLYEDPYFMTFKKIKEAGGSVRKGAKSTPVMFWNWIYLDENGKKVKTEEEADKKIPVIRYYNVFNACDIEGIDFKYPEVVENDNDPIDLCERIVSATNVKLLHGGSRAYYRPSADIVKMPRMSVFDSSEAYYSVLFHELTHWTGHSSRMDRGLDTNPCVFGSTDYSKEELIAEFGAAFLCEHTGISKDHLLKNSAAYLKGWVSKLNEKPEMLLYAANSAEKAVNHILSYSSTDSKDKTKEVATTVAA